MLVGKFEKLNVRCFVGWLNVYCTIQSNFIFFCLMMGDNLWLKLLRDIKLLRVHSIISWIYLKGKFREAIQLIMSKIELISYNRSPKPWTNYLNSCIVSLNHVQ